MIYRLSNYTNYRQLFLIIISIFFDLIFLLFYLINGSINVYLLITAVIIQVFLNVINSFLYDVWIEDKKIFVKNLYKKTEVLDGLEFSEITHFSKFYLLKCVTPRLYNLKLKSGKNYLFISNSLKALLSVFTFGLYTYVDELNRTIRQQLK